MPHTPFLPNTLSRKVLTNIDLQSIIPYIDWNFFFLAWRIAGKYNGIESVHDCTSCKVTWLQQFSEANRPKAEEALQLYKDAQALLRKMLEENAIRAHAIFGIYEAYSRDEDICLTHNDKTIVLPMLRQQHLSTDGFCYSLSDFIAPNKDYVGIFATTITGSEEYANKLEREDDMYRSIMVKTLADRLAEATTEWLHAEVRTKYWGYASDENLGIQDMLHSKYQGIRPAVGYPSLPDQSIIFVLDTVINFSEIGIQLTENGAMFPTASVCGLYFAHPQSKYFMVGKIDDQQLQDYARRCGKTPATLKKWLAANI